MAFCCWLHLKEECDACGACMGVLEDDDDDEDPFVDYDIDHDERI